jgi:deoxycytidylate deaminase
MITDIDFQRMLKAKELDWLSNCTRRKIGVYIPLPADSDGAMFAAIGGNSTQQTNHCCKRDIGICPAVHAEVNAIMNLGRQRLEAKALYIWAEIPCHACLSYIRRFSSIRDIYCLTTESYGIEYPRVLDRIPEIKLREEYASMLDLNLHQLDAKEIYELLNATLDQSESHPA